MTEPQLDPVPKHQPPGVPGESGHGHAGDAHAPHGHAHGLLQDLTAVRLGKAFALATGLNLLFVVIEATYGVLANSTALLADAAHNLSDVLGLVLAWAASAMARRRPSSRHTYGLRKTTVLAALANAVLLLVAVGGVVWEAMGRFSTAQPIKGATVLTVALCGVLVNGLSAALFAKSAKGDANVRGAFLHLVADAAVSVGVVVVGAVLLWQPSWAWLDPAVSLVIAVVILVGTWRLLREALHLSLDGVPADIELRDVRIELQRLPGVIDVHDLHVWAMSTSETALTAHVVVDGSAPANLASVAGARIGKQFGIHHTTVQIDTPEQVERCRTC